jgi:hypothetical protein
MVEIFNEQTAKFLEPAQDILQFFSISELPTFELIYNLLQKCAANFFGAHTGYMAGFLLTYH